MAGKRCAGGAIALWTCQNHPPQSQRQCITRAIARQNQSLPIQTNRGNDHVKGCARTIETDFKRCARTISKADDKMDAQCEWCPHVCTQAKPRCNMMAGYVEAQMRERLAYACNRCSAYQTLDDRIVALAFNWRAGQDRTRACQSRRTGAELMITETLWHAPRGTSNGQIHE